MYFVICDAYKSKIEKNKLVFFFYTHKKKRKSEEKEEMKMSLSPPKILDNVIDLIFIVN